jgi:hypothetical protein
MTTNEFDPWAVLMRLEIEVFDPESFGWKQFIAL